MARVRTRVRARATIGTVIVLLATPFALSAPHAAAGTALSWTDAGQPGPTAGNPSGNDESGEQGGAAAAKPHVPLRTRFATANTTHDGHLTLAQARAAGLRSVVHNFAAIDADHKGFVTLGDIRAFHRPRKAAAVSGAPAPSPSSSGAQP